MNICIITGQETSSLTKNFPLSIEGRKLLPTIVQKHNDKIEELFVEKAMENNENLTREFAAKLAPKISTRKALQLLQVNEADMALTRAEVIGEWYEKK